MFKVIISEIGLDELKKLNFDIKDEINKIIEFVPREDLIGLSHIYITNLPEKWKNHLANAGGSYHQKHNNNAAFIELYLKRLLGDIKSSKQVNMTLPILSVIIAQTIFHEVGHHIERTRSHGVKKRGKESVADQYSKKYLNNYILENTDSINKCFDGLKKGADSIGLSPDRYRDIKANWDKMYMTATTTK